VPKPPPARETPARKVARPRTTAVATKPAAAKKPRTARAAKAVAVRPKAAAARAPTRRRSTGPATATTEPSEPSAPPPAAAPAPVPVLGGAGAESTPEASLPPIPPILLEGDPEPRAYTGGPGHRYAWPPEALEPVPEMPEELWDLDQDYGLGRLWLAARDPHTLHASWDLTPGQVAAAGERLALRVFAGREPVGAFREVALPRGAHSVFVPAEAADEWFVAAIGFTDPVLGWQELARSTPVRTPTLASREAPVEQFVMLTLPPEPEAPGPREEVPAPETIPPAPAPAVLAPEAGPVPVAPVNEAAPARPAPALEEPPPAPLPVPEPVRAQPASGVVPPAAPAPREATIAALGPAAAISPISPRLQPTAPPPWSPEQTQALAAVEAEWGVLTAPSSLALAVGAAAREGAGPAGPSSPAAGFGPVGARMELPSSAAVPAPPAAGAGRRFWFNINAELVVYGATEPDARVTVDGEPVALRPDGSFTLRFALPDGEYALHAVAEAADGVEHRQARLTFARRTHYRGAVGRAPADPTLTPPRPEGPTR